jgi:hypothetical protein
VPSIIHENVKNALFHYEFVELIIRLIEGGLAPSSQRVGSLLKPPWQAKPAVKNGFDKLPSGQKVLLPKNM